MMAVPAMKLIGLPHTASAALWLGPDWGCLYARPDQDDLLTRLVLLRDGVEEVLWDGAIAVDPRFYRASEDLALCLFPGQALFAIRRVQGATMCSELAAPQGARLPAMIAPPADGLWAGFDHSDIPCLCPLELQETNFTLGTALELPDLARDSRISALLRDRSGAMTLVADNLREGFELWQRSAEGAWTRRIEKGCWRYGFNAAVTALLADEDGLCLAAGLGAQAQVNLLGMSAKPELLRLDTDGPCRMIVGEPRYSPTGLMRPEAENAPPARYRGTITAMCHTADGPCLAMVRKDGTSWVLALEADGGVSQSEVLDGDVLELVPAPGDELVVVMRYAEGFRLMEG